ncbi:hypothetical protein EAS64_11145 [Trebonia kvetii]|uniref:Clp R domain-containing protein n=1 Tax=Trebonia kvetii TaxID=2480626 RepID=A0A6P2C1S8_9ACTN|nr:Clp protease N-terminal domain-containing protein [Trebonia kvetii]TVZ05148.1 hypothetical protein EAS64_11145 [Trebonia kvetii]
MASQERYPELYLGAIHRGFQYARELGRQCGPLHLLVGVAEGGGPAAAALDPGDGRSLRAAVSDAGDAFGDGAGYLQMQAQDAATSLAASLGQQPAAGHLLTALLDQATPDVLRALSLAGLDPAAVRQAALAAVGAPAGLPPLKLPRPVPAGTLDRPALPIGELAERAWDLLRWRQDHLPLGKLRRRGDLAALGNLECDAALRVADRLGLADDQRYSLMSRHDAEVTRRTSQAGPDLGPRIRRPPPRYRRMRYRPRWLAGLPGGWAAWLGNRRVSMRDRWFWLRTRASYRGTPQL